MTGVELRHGAITDVGRVRAINEDAFLVAPPVFVVADGMGGHEHGDVASRIVVEEFGALADAGYPPADPAPVVAATIETCFHRLAEYAAGQPAAAPGRSPGTTVVAALLAERDDEPSWLLVNLGDSRVYRVHDGAVDQVSVDHSLVQQLVDAGTITPDEADEHPERHVITRALGGPHLEEADYFWVPAGRGERLLLCSDGVSGLVPSAELAALLLGTADPQQAAEQVVAAALAAGGDDNATAVVVDVMGLSLDQTDDSGPRPASPDQDPEAQP